MTGWIILAVYVVGYLVCWRGNVWTVATGFNEYPIDGYDIVMGLVIGTILTLFWPVVLLGRGAFKLVKHTDNRLIMPRNVARRRELDKREAEIKRMERELDIK